MAMIDLSELRGYISDMYSDVARFPRGDFHFPTGRPLMERLGYDPAILDQVPKTAMESFAGVGHHFAMDPLKPGERVLDLGSGSGSDVLFAAIQVGSEGQATGIDMTEAMLEKSNKNREKGDFNHVTFVKGLVEQLPFDDDSFDCVISNGVINLTPDKLVTFQGIKRVLKPGGRLMFSDIVTGVELPQSVRENCELWAECIGGAWEQDSYVELIRQAGLDVETVNVNQAYAFTQESTINAASKFAVRSISVLAYKK